MTNHVTIPTTVDEAGDRLGGLHRLFLATEWERAAIVFAFTAPQQGKRTSTTSGGSHSIVEFAGFGIQGLRSVETVRRYRNAWATTGRPAVPGGTVDLDGLGSFPPDDQIDNPDRREHLNSSAEAEGAGTQSTQQIATHLPAMKAAIKGDAKVAAAASAALDELHDEFVSARQPRPERRSDTARTEHADALSLMVKLRAAHRALADVAAMAHNIRGLGADDLREGVIAEVMWIRGACDVIETGANGGPLDSQLEELLDAEAGR